MLTDELDHLVDHLRDLNRPVVDQLVPGVDLADANGVLDGSVPPSVVTWFRWCNGVSTARGQIQDEISVIPGYYPLSVSEALSIVNDYSGDISLPGTWIPLLGSGGGDVYAALWGPDGEDAKIVDIMIGESEDVAFRSIGDMVAFFNQCYQHGAFFVNAEGMLSIEPTLYSEFLSLVH